MSTPAWLPIVVAGTSAIGGLVVGAVWGRVTASPSDRLPPVEIARAYTAEELQIACQPLMRQTASTLQEAQVRVVALQDQIREKADEVSRLESAAAADSATREEVERRLGQARRQLRSLEAALLHAEREKEVLEAELVETREVLESTRVRLDDQRSQTVAAKRVATSARWTGFVQDAQLTLCAKGTKARLQRCRDAVETALVAHEARYLGCIRDGYGAPTLHVADRGEAIPTFATWLDDDTRELQGAYILFCDPSLPESTRRLPDHASRRPPDDMLPDFRED